MTPDRIDHTPDGEPENGVLSDSQNLDTTALGIIGGMTEQVTVSIPVDEDDDLGDDDVVDDELAPEALGALRAESEAFAATGHADDEAVIEASLETGEIETPEPVRVDTAAAEWASVGGDADGDVVIADVDLDAVDGAEYVVEAYTSPEPGAESETAQIVAELPVADVPENSDAHDVPGAESADADQTESRDEEPSHAAPASSAESPLSLAPAQAGVPTSTPVSAPVGVVAPGPTPSGSIPTTRREAMHPELSDRANAVERIHPNPDVTLTSKRLGEFEAGRESSDLLTPDRLLDPHQVVRPEPEGAWQHFVYSLTGHRVNLGDSKRARDRKALDRRISVALPGGARFVPVLSRKGGVGKTTVTTLLGMALADARDDRIIAIDANPDRGTLAERIARANGKTIRDLVRMRADVSGFSDISSIVARDETRLDVLASDADPRVSEALSDRDYHDVASLAAHYYSIVLTDTGTGIVHSVMSATLDVADQLVIVSGLSVDEARLASETLTWLETNGYAEDARNAVVVLNNARPGAPLIRQDELEAHFGSRVRAVVRMPYDPLIAAGSAITFRDLQPATRLAARGLAATVVEGLRSLAPAA